MSFKTILLAGLYLAAGSIFLEAQVPGHQTPKLPFKLTITKTPIENLPDYLTEKSPDEWMDFPVSATRMDGEFWVMLKNGETKPAYRFKGTNFENARREPDGVITTPVSRPYILGGMWYDSTDQKLYAPLHCETRGYYTTILRQITLASSTDKGLTWKYEGPVMTRDDPTQPLPSGRESSGQYWDGGEGDFFLFADEKEGYVYLYTNHYVWSKTGIDGPPFGFFTFMGHHVARCAIKDKLAPGKWRKFYNGSWSEPALGGKASDVKGYYVMYNTYLKKYISFDYNSSISVCTDLSKQDWSPNFKVTGDAWGYISAAGAGVGAWHVLNEAKNNVFTGGKTLWLYAYWEKKFYGLYKLDLGAGETPDTAGYYAGYAGKPVTSMDPSRLYLFGSRYESDDPIEARHTRRVSCSHADLSYQGTWTPEANREYYDSTAMISAAAGSQVQFTFRGSDVYWRAVKGPDCGKADVYIDNKLEKTVDCYSSAMTPYQFAWIVKDLDPERNHIIKIIVKGESNPKSSGTVIKHLLFEYSAESYRTSDGFSNVMGKNSWFYQQKINAEYSDLKFADPFWSGGDKTELGYTHMTAESHDAVRKWIAPHDGEVRVEGAIRQIQADTSIARFEIMKNATGVWPSKTVPSGKAVNHDFNLTVQKGDALYFILKKNVSAGPEKVVWDPVVTYL